MPQRRFQTKRKRFETIGVRRETVNDTVTATLYAMRMIPATAKVVDIVPASKEYQIVLEEDDG